MNPQNVPPVLSQVPKLVVNFSLSRWDVFRCRLRAIVLSRFNVLLSLGLGVGMPLILLSNSETELQSLGSKVFYVIFHMLTLLCIIAIFQVVIQVLMLFSQKNRGILGSHELEIRDDGLVERTDVNESLHRWSAFHKISSTRNFIFIYVTDNIVHYVPFRSFASESEATLFKNEILRRANATKSHAQ